MCSFSSKFGLTFELKELLGSQTTLYKAQVELILAIVVNFLLEDQRNLGGFVLSSKGTSL